MKKYSLYDFVVEQINLKLTQKKVFVNKRWILNDYYKLIETPTSKFTSHKRNIESIFLYLTKTGFLQSQGNNIFKVIKLIPSGLTSYELRKSYDNLLKNLK